MKGGILFINIYCKLRQKYMYRVQIMKSLYFAIVIIYWIYEKKVFNCNDLFINVKYIISIASKVINKKITLFFRNSCYFVCFPLASSFMNSTSLCQTYVILFPISRSLSTSRRRTDELGYHLERPIHFECKLNEPMHIGMRLLHPAAADHSVSISRQQVQRIFSFLLRSRVVTSFCSWLLLNE